MISPVSPLLAPFGQGRSVMLRPRWTTTLAVPYVKSWLCRSQATDRAVNHAPACVLRGNAVDETRYEDGYLRGAEVPGQAIGQYTAIRAGVREVHDHTIHPDLQPTTLGAGTVSQRDRTWSSPARRRSPRPIRRCFARRSPSAATARSRPATSSAPDDLRHVAAKVPGVVTETGPGAEPSSPSCWYPPAGHLLIGISNTVYRRLRGAGTRCRVAAR